MEGSVILDFCRKIIPDYETTAQTLTDPGSNIIVLVLQMYSHPEVADLNCLQPGIQEIVMLPDKEVSVCSNPDTSE